MRAAVVVVGLVACKYSAPDAVTPGGDASPTPDQATDGTPIVCEANTKACNGRTLLTCNAEGTGIASQVTCPLTCDVDHCTQASNIDAAMQMACDANAPAYTASTNAGIRGDLVMVCDGCTDIAPTRVELGAIDLAIYCVSHFEIPAGVTFNIADGIDAAIAVFVVGDAQIDGTIDLRGQSTGSNAGLDAALGGAGGFAGGTRADANKGPGNAGAGACGGGGGASTTGTSNVGGGGGGGGYRTLGAAGGTGTQVTPAATADGGGAGPICASSPPELEPLIGGSGGGSGGDGSCTGVAACGVPGGAGGGAIQISATATLAFGASGRITANGGSGAFLQNSANDRGAGGGGGAGGAILLEATTLSVSTALLEVNGGNGGDSIAGAGGTGATPFAVATKGGDGGSDRGGGGGGGAIGKIRLNAKTGATCPAAGGNDPCTSSTLKLAPAPAKPR